MRQATPFQSQFRELFPKQFRRQFRKQFRKLFRVPLLAPLLACGSPSSPPSRAALLVESGMPSYELEGKASPTFTLRHEGGAQVVISGCPEAPSAILERQAESGWTDEATRGMVCPSVYQLQVDTLTDGESRHFALAPWRHGRYRVRVIIGASAASPERTILSNEFDMH